MVEGLERDQPHGVTSLLLSGSVTLKFSVKIQAVNMFG